MRRRLFNAGAAVSLMMCLALIALWVRSYWRAEGLVLRTRQSSTFIESTSGTLIFHRTRHLIGAGLLSGYSTPALREPHHRYLEVRIPGPSEVTLTTVEIRLPHALVAAAAAVPPAVWVYRRHRQRRRASPACPACGYDLRGSAGKSCPECGHQVTGVTMTRTSCPL